MHKNTHKIEHLVLKNTKYYIKNCVEITVKY